MAWDPDPLALHANRWESPDDDGPTTILLRHPTAPFVRNVASLNNDPVTNVPGELAAIALDYLNEANQKAKLRLPAEWLDALDPGTSNPGFRWLGLSHPSEGGDFDPLSSFWCHRPAEGGPWTGTLILIASEIANFASGGRSGLGAMGSEFGIRIVAHVRGDPGNGYEARFTGLSASLPFGKYRLSPEHGPVDIGPDLFEKARDFVAPSLGLDANSIHFRGIRLGEPEQSDRHFELRGRGQGNAKPGHVLSAVTYEFLLAGTVSDNWQDWQPRNLKKVPLGAGADAGWAPVFKQDPASQGGPKDLIKRRPGRPETARDPDAALGKYLEWVQIAPDLTAVLRRPDDPDADALLKIIRTQYVRADLPPRQPPKPEQKIGDVIVKDVNLPGTGPAIRSDDFTAVAAFYNLGQLFDRLDTYGIDVSVYFRGADLPIHGAYRSGVRPGPGKSGQTINARVLPEDWDTREVELAHFGYRPKLEVHLAIADFTRRGRKPWDGKTRSPAEPLGIATDPRWMWHEIGHVLQTATIGELELRFGHSVGDALAAIIADPASGLSTDRNWRGATFPWVFLPRRHDRCVAHGWSWSGTMGRSLARAPDADRLRRKGYRIEQVLSSSLFRLYLCLGGEPTEEGRPVPNVAARERASHDIVYLIIKALCLLGEARLAPAARPEQLVSALIEADIGTETFPVGGRIGGCAHKAIRWAFEAQGMYAPGSGEIDTGSGDAEPESGPINNAPGRAEPVDIYIEDRRAKEELTRNCRFTFGPGTYAPVSLDWGQYLGGTGIPGWFSVSEGGIEERDGHLFVSVGNRGRTDAENVIVNLYWHQWVTGDPPEWGSSGWNELGSSGPKDVPARPDSPVEFGPFDLPATSEQVLIFAEATCPADRANTDVATDLPCSRTATPLPDLVANDNNLGLIVLAPEEDG